MNVKIRIFASHNSAQWNEESACTSIEEARAACAQILDTISQENADAIEYYKANAEVVNSLVALTESPDKCIICGKAKLINYGHNGKRVPLCREHNRYMFNLERQQLVGPYNWAEKLLSLRELPENVNSRKRADGEYIPRTGGSAPRTRKDKNADIPWEEF